MHAPFVRQRDREGEGGRERESELWKRFQNGRRVPPIVFEKGLRMYVYPVPKRRGMSAVWRIWHIQDRPGQVTALGFRLKSLKPLKLFPLDAEAVYRVQKGRGIHTPCSKGAPNSSTPPLHICDTTPPLAGFREPRNLCGVVFRWAACSPGLGVGGWGLWVSGSEFRVQGLGFEVQGLGLEFKIQVLEF